MTEVTEAQGGDTVVPVSKPSRKPRTRRATEAQAAAGEANLQGYLETAPAPPALTSGVYAAATRAGQLPAGREELQTLIDSFYQGWIADLGGDENLTAARRALLWTARGCLAMFALGLESIRDRGLVGDLGEVQPVAKVLASFANTLRLNLLACGLDRTPRNIATTLEQKLAELSARETDESSDEK